MRALAVVGAAFAVLAGCSAAAAGPSVYDRWAGLTLPPPPELASADVEAAHAALLILDMNAVNCSMERRPTCVATLPSIRGLLVRARTHGMLVVYSGGAATSAMPQATPPEIAPLPGEPMVRAPVDKFFASDLDRILAARGIKTVIVTGTSAEGAVLYTASSASLRGLKVVVPVDGYSSADPFAEAYTAWHLRNAPVAVTKNIVLTSSDHVTIR